MRKGLLALGAAAAVAGSSVIGAVAWADPPGGIREAKTIRFIENDTQSQFVDVDRSGGPTPGDVFAFAGDLLKPADKHRIVGSIHGNCTLNFGNYAECAATARLTGRGDIQANFAEMTSLTAYDIAITGGTGEFRNARGEVHIHRRSPTQLLDTAHLTP